MNGDERPELNCIGGEPERQGNAIPEARDTSDSPSGTRKRRAQFARARDHIRDEYGELFRRLADA